MNAPPIVHGSFSIERTFRASAARVFAAWADVETKARWFLGPPDTWKVVQRELDLRVGGTEILHGQFANGPVTLFTARYHSILPNERLVYVYDMQHGGRQLSVSLASVELAGTKDGGTHLRFTEQAAFLDGEDGTRSREIGTAAHLDRLGLVLDDPRQIVSSRIVDAAREQVFEAFLDPRQLERWWGPNGFTNSFQEFDARPGGAWRHVMRGPDGSEHPMTKRFVEVVRPERIVFQHLSQMHDFSMTMSYRELAGKTLLAWRMQFDADQPREVRAIIDQANEQNFDRLAAHLATLR